LKDIAELVHLLYTLLIPLAALALPNSIIFWHIRLVDLGYFKNLKEPMVFMKEPMVLFDFFKFMRIVIMYQK
jgi:hypothetical protein